MFRYCLIKTLRYNFFIHNNFLDNNISQYYNKIFYSCDDDSVKGIASHLFIYMHVKENIFIKGGTKS